MTFDQFKKRYRSQEAAEGTNLEKNGDNISQKPPATDEELRQLHNNHKATGKTGLYDHGDATTPDPVLTMKSFS